MGAFTDGSRKATLSVVFPWLNGFEQAVTSVVIGPLGAGGEAVGENGGALD
jgi:hypothetical protein